MKKITKEEAAQRIEDKFPGKFVYDINEFIDTQHKIHLTCNECGNTFERKYNNLMNNGICPYCNGTKENWDTEWFIKKSEEIHGEKYDYSLVEYCGTDKKVPIICHKTDVFGDEHGIFYVTPHAHLGLNSGCPKCSGKYRTNTKEFIDKAKLVHGDKYLYNKTVYVRALSPVIITCPIHGDFLQKPNGHLNGQGCPVCKQSYMEREIRNLLEENKIKFIQEYSPKWLSPLHLDFYLPDYDMAIECQGAQHFLPVKYYKGEEGLKIRKERDERKKMKCCENGVRIIYYANYEYKFPYEVITDKKKLLEIIKR